MNIGEPSGSHMRWRLRIATFYFVVTYKKGAQNAQADALSHLSTEREALLQPEGNKISWCTMGTENSDVTTLETYGDPP